LSHSPPLQQNCRGCFISWHSAAAFDGLKMLGVGFKVEAVIRGEMCAEKTEEE